VAVVVDGARVDVLDRGPGIAADDRSRVFDRFYRASNARTQPGSGLGLAIVKQIADLHHATVTIDPRPGGGTASRIEFVASPTPTSTSADPAR
jgi:two-component system sensor histidine kinase MprB